MRKMIFAAMLLALGLPARAQKLNQAEAVKTVVPYQMSCASTTVATTAGDVSGNTSISSTTAGVSAIKVVNLSATANVYCSHDSGVTTSATLIGDFIAPSPATGPRNYLYWGINVAQKWYCVSDTNGSPILVCKLR